MKSVLIELNELIAQIIIYLNTQPKIVPQQKTYLSQVLSEIIDGKPISPELRKWVEALKEVEKAKYTNYIPVYAKLLHSINNLGIWHLNNSPIKIPNSELHRYRKIRERVIDHKEFSDDDLSTLVKSFRYDEED